MFERWGRRWECVCGCAVVDPDGWFLELRDVAGVPSGELVLLARWPDGGSLRVAQYRPGLLPEIVAWFTDEAKAAIAPIPDQQEAAPDHHGGGPIIDTIRFVANEVSLDPQVGFVGFADAAGRYFWMQPGEMTSSKDEIWLERDDQAWGGCGGAWTIVLTRDKFTVCTRELPWMACDAVEIELAVDEATYTRLKELLRKIMAGCPADLDIRN